MITYACESCKKVFQRRKGYSPSVRFCSRACVCRGTVAGWNKTNIVHTCEQCGIVFKIKPFEIADRRTCSRKCLGKLQSKERRGKFRVREKNHGWRGGRSIAYYRRLFRDNLPKECNRCKSKRHIVVHHIDRNRQNNDLKNLEVLCTRCHHIEHGRFDHRDSSGRFTSSSASCDVQQPQAD